MTKPVTSGQLRDTLNGLGFVADPGGGHVIFRHPETGLILSVPNVEGKVRPIYVVTAAHQIAQFGIATEAAFAARLAKAARNGHLQAV
jgi:predicted RNA binding protein YcfA (HicA-like mRNA interferase family)